MTAILLDTSVPSLLHPKRRGSPQRARYEPFLRGHMAALSFQTVAELWAWAEQRAWAQAQRTGLGVFLARFVLLPHTDELNRAWALVMTQARRAGRRLEAGDGWIAATAVHYSVPLLKQDADFVGLGVTGLELVAVAADTDPSAAR